jgi:hypothetical protein
MDTRLKVLLSVGLVMICLGLVAVLAGAELGCQHSSEQAGAEQGIDAPQYTQNAVINMAKNYLEAEYLYDVDNEIASSRAEYLGNGLWKVEFYGKQAPRTCPRQADIPHMIVYVNEKTGVIG